jgi:hypothetical protein
LKVSGFTIASNAIRFDYLVVESIKSMLPIVDEFIVNYGQLRNEKTLNEKWQSIKKYHRERAVHNQSIDFYQYFPRQFVTPYKERHPKVMAGRIKKHPVSLDLSSPSWRTTLTLGEKWLLLKTLFVTKVTDRLSGRGSYRLLKR